VVLSVLLVTSVHVLAHPELPQRTARLRPAPTPLLLGPGTTLVIGQVRALEEMEVDGHRCVAALDRVADRRGTYLWRVRSRDFELETDGQRLRVAGVIVLSDEGVVVEGRLSTELPLHLPVERVLLRDGDRVEVRGRLGKEQVAASFRESAEVAVMRGVPGFPVEIRRLSC
jgi:hypothetical protein